MVASYGAICGLIPQIVSAQNQPTFQRLDKVTNIAEVWQPKKHLYVKGDVGLSIERLNSLEDWLQENGQHWTIVLIESSADESYTARWGRKTGMDAVEHALGIELSGKTKFGDLSHPLTGQADGCIFVLSKKDRSMNYFASEAQDQRRLGEAQWFGNLDQKAIRAMRSGERVADAVKDTVTHINSRLARAIKAEAKALQDAERRQQQKELRRQQDAETLRTEFRSLIDKEIAMIRSSSNQLKANFPEAINSTLANPPIAALLSEAEQAIKSVAPDSIATSRKRLEELKRQSEKLLDAYAMHQHFDTLVAQLETRIDQVADHPSKAAVNPAKESILLLDELKLAHRRAETGLDDRAEKIESLLEIGRQQIRQFEAQQKKEAERKRTVKNTLLMGGGISIASIFGLLWLLNWRRRRALNRAYDAFELASSGFSIRQNRTTALANRTFELLGKNESEATNSYQGTTRS